MIAEAIAGDEDDFAKHDDAQGARARHEPRRSTATPPACPTTSRSPPRATRPRSAARSRTASRATTATSRPRPSFIAATSIRNHNRLLGSVEGVDGIKTGYTRASGFNLVTSMRRGNRHLVGVVLGGRSGGSRDATMRSLLAENLDKGATTRTVAAITERGAARSQCRGRGSRGRSRPRRCRSRAPCRSPPPPSPASTPCRPPAPPRPPSPR